MPELAHWSSERVRQQLKFQLIVATVGIVVGVMLVAYAPWIAKIVGLALCGGGIWAAYAAWGNHLRSATNVAVSGDYAELFVGNKHLHAPFLCEFSHTLFGNPQLTITGDGHSASIPLGLLDLPQRYQRIGFLDTLATLEIKRTPQNSGEAESMFIAGDRATRL